jgi:hypothetical protein
MVKMCNCPFLAGTSEWVQRVQAGLRLGLGVQGQLWGGGGFVGWGLAELGLGGQEVLKRLPDHSSLALLKSFNFRYRLTAAPFRKK